MNQIFLYFHHKKYQHISVRIHAYSAFADLQGAVLHPFVILFTLMAGVLNGAKLTLAAAVISAGLAQYSDD